ncbi:MAG: uroporphyrinogen decarboxylase family protein [Anaerolineae bacterium]|jgi:uroporphyrinogen decarboxylase
MPKETMTPRERWLAVLTRQQPDRTPMDYWTTPEADCRLKRHLGVSTDRELYERLHIDRPIGAGPRYVGPPLSADEDIFGVRYRDVSYGLGSYREAVTHPLARYASVAEIEADYAWPSPDWWAYDRIADETAYWSHHPIAGGGSEPFLTYKNLRGDEQAFVDLVMHPDIVHYCLDRLFDLAFVNTVRILEAIPGQVTYCYVAEDMGSQTGLLFSPRHIHMFLIPRMKRMIDLAHSAGAYVFYHSDGAVRAILPDMIAAGIDILNPIQWRCAGMERGALKRDFGQQVVMHGGVDNQHTLAFGSVAEVRAEVIENLTTLGAGGGYILAPCHNIQSVSPPENIVALYETGYHEGWSPSGGG